MSERNPVFAQFINDLAQKMGNKKIAIIGDEKDLPNISGALIDSLPVLIKEFTSLENPDLSYWVRLREIMNQVSYGVLFFNASNLASLSLNQRQAKLEDVKGKLAELGLKVDQIGWNFSTTGASGLIVLLENINHPDGKSVPSNFRVVAMLNTFNEEDIIVPSIRQLKNEGLQIYFIDNQSTDKTYQLAEQMLGDALIGIEKWPEDVTEDIFPQEELLKQKEDLALTIEADWFIHIGADEIRESPWQGLNLREAIWKVDQLGYNAIDFTIINFLPVDNGFIPGSNFKNYFEFFEFAQNPGALKQIRCWKKQAVKVNLHQSGGHLVVFPGRKVFPLKFLIRHYPYRSQEHAEKKVFQERKPRFDPRERRMGFHVQYDHFQKGSTFVKDKADLLKFNQTFYSDFLIERLSGIGVKYHTIKAQLEEIRTCSRSKQLKKQTKSLRNRLLSVERQLRVKEEASNSLKLALLEKEQEILFYSQSKSWKITRPLRTLMDFLRRIIR